MPPHIWPHMNVEPAILNYIPPYLRAFTNAVRRTRRTFASGGVLLKRCSFTTFVLITLMSSSALAQGPASGASIAVAKPRQDGSSSGDRVAACPLAELVLDPERRVSATFTSNGFVLELRAELRDGQVISSVSVDGGRIVTSLAIPEGERIVPSLDGLVIEAGRVATKQLAAADIATGARRVALIAAYDDMAQTLFEATPALGNTQLRYALMYHTSVVRIAYRLIDAEKAGVVNVCTPSREYLYGVAAFRCSEDYAGAAALRDIIRPRDGEPNEPQLRPYPCNGAKGSALGCCGNYSGPCWYCNTICLIHDILCLDCDHWYCGWQCQPGGFL